MKVIACSREMTRVEVQQVIPGARVAVMQGQGLWALVYFNEKNNTDTLQDYSIEVPKGEHIVRLRYFNSETYSQLFEEWIVTTCIDYPSVCTSSGIVEINMVRWDKPTLFSKIIARIAVFLKK